VTGPFRSGYVSIIGRPNVGKSTLLNVLLGQKVAIVSAKPQTTRNRIMGIRTTEDAQIIFIDTPGIHSPKNLLGKTMIAAVKEAMREIDLVVFVTDAGRHFKDDKVIAEFLGGVEVPVILLINKIDLVPRAELLPMTAAYGELFPFREIIPVSALKRDGTDILLRKITEYLPEGPRYYPDEYVTDQIERSMAAEIVREKIMAKTSDEIPYSVAVEVVEWKEREDGLISISAHIYVEREGQKGIIIGEKGRVLKSIGTLARTDLERLLNARVFLQLWVKVKKGWRDDKRVLDDLGYK
jgi:GTP-binding protein Era